MITLSPRARRLGVFSSSLNRVVHIFIAQTRPGRTCAKNRIAGGFILGRVIPNYSYQNTLQVRFIGDLSGYIPSFWGRITETA